MDHLPIFCQLKQRPCLLVGGGDVAERKARLLMEAGARVTVNALAFTPQFQVWHDEGALTLAAGPFDASLMDDCWLVIAATNDDAVNAQVSDAAEAREAAAVKLIGVVVKRFTNIGLFICVQFVELLQQR